MRLQNNKGKLFKYAVTVNREPFASIKDCAEHFGFDRLMLQRQITKWRKNYKGNPFAELPYKIFPVLVEMKEPNKEVYFTKTIKVRVTVLNQKPLPRKSSAE